MKNPARPLCHLLMVVCPLLMLFTTAACIPGEVDSLFTVQAPKPFYEFLIAKHIRGSELWCAYLEYLAEERTGEGPVISIDVGFEREITEQHTSSGDYDPGVVYADAALKELRTGTTLLTDHQEFEIPNHVIVRQGGTREEVQDRAFAEVEENAVSSIIQVLDLAVVRAIAQEGSQARALIPVLEETHDKHWSVALVEEAKIALESIRGSTTSGGRE